MAMEYTKKSTFTHRTRSERFRVQTFRPRASSDLIPRGPDCRIPHQSPAPAS